MESCLVLARPDFLWDQAFPRFKQAGQAGSFLEQLQPHILAGHFSALAPEVMQVEYISGHALCVTLLLYVLKSLELKLWIAAAYSCSHEVNWANV